MVSRSFDGRPNTYYPPKIRFLVVVRGKHQDSLGTTFSFKLHLMPELVVYASSDWTNRFNRLVAPVRQKGWHFLIEGNYNTRMALDAYEAYQNDPDLRSPDPIKLSLLKLGLEAACESYKRAAYVFTLPVE